MFIGLWNFADDAGRMVNEAKTIKAQVFPGDDDVSSETIRGMIYELSTIGLIQEYEVGGRLYLQITGWDHQRIDKPKPSKIPAPPVVDPSSINPRPVAPDLPLSNPTVSVLGEGGKDQPAGSLASARDERALASPPTGGAQRLSASPALIASLERKAGIR
jgi:hypothetical protein